MSNATVTRAKKLYPALFAQCAPFNDSFDDLISLLEFEIDQYDMDDDVYDLLEGLEVKQDTKDRAWVMYNDQVFFFVPDAEKDYTDSRWKNLDELDENEYADPTEENKDD